MKKKNKYLTDFGKRLKIAIKSKFKIQKNFAILLGVTEKTLNSWIKGKSIPDNIITLTHIATILDISLDWLMLGKTPLKLDPNLFNKVIQATNTWVTVNKEPISEASFTYIYKNIYKEYTYK